MYEYIRPKQANLTKSPPPLDDVTQKYGQTHTHTHTHTHADAQILYTPAFTNISVCRIKIPHWPFPIFQGFLLHSVFSLLLDFAVFYEPLPFTTDARSTLLFAFCPHIFTFNSRKSFYALSNQFGLDLPTFLLLSGVHSQFFLASLTLCILIIWRVCFHLLH
jgi:hypothetical protein